MTKEVQNAVNYYFAMSAITALRQSRCLTAALIAARSYFRKELLSARPRRRRFKTCSGQELKMKNNSDIIPYLC